MNPARRSRIRSSGSTPRTRRSRARWRTQRRSRRSASRSTVYDAPMRRVNIEVIHETKLATEAEVRRVVRALQRQVHEDFAPVWGIDAELAYAASLEKADPEAWHVV